MSRGFKLDKLTRTLRRLSSGPTMAADLLDAADEVPGTIARYMLRLERAGLTANVALKRGRGTLALYDLTPTGRAWLARITAREAT